MNLIDLGEWPAQLQQLKADGPVTQAGEEGLTPQIVIDYINNHYEHPIVATDVVKINCGLPSSLKLKDNTKC